MSSRPQWGGATPSWANVCCSSGRTGSTGGAIYQVSKAKLKPLSTWLWTKTTSTTTTTATATFKATTRVGQKWNALLAIAEELPGLWGLAPCLPWLEEQHVSTLVGILFRSEEGNMKRWKSGWQVTGKCILLFASGHFVLPLSTLHTTLLPLLALFFLSLNGTKLVGGKMFVGKESLQLALGYDLYLRSKKDTKNGCM